MMELLNNSLEKPDYALKGNLVQNQINYTSSDRDFIEGLKTDFEWQTDNVIYTFNSIEGKHGDEDITGYKLFNNAQREATKDALAEFTKVADIKFEESTSSSKFDANLVIRAADMPGNTAGWAFQPSDFWGSDLTIDNQYDGSASGFEKNYFGLEKGQFGFKLLLHELGHAMGLGHPHEAGTVSTEADSLNASVMSYYSSSSSSIGGQIATGAGPYSPQTLMIYDIASLQEIYGANHQYNSGNNTYTLDGNIYVGTIWDGNGNDSLDSSGYSGSSVLDLREGLENITKVGETYSWNAFGANIENAISGNGNDNIYGNSLNNYIKANAGSDKIEGFAGDDDLRSNTGNDTIDGGEGNDFVRGGKDSDTVSGGAGSDWVNGNNQNDIVNGDSGNDTIHGGKNNDTLHGGSGDDFVYGDKGNDILFGDAGSDRFVFKNDFGSDSIEDFEVNTDIIAISRSLVSDLDSLLSSINYSNNNAIINISDIGSINIKNITDNGLDVDDFTLI